MVCCILTYHKQKMAWRVLLRLYVKMPKNDEWVRWICEVGLVSGLKE
jgi:hypothetical protein